MFKKFNEEDLLYTKIPGVTLRPLLESFMCEGFKNLKPDTPETEIMAKLVLWKDKEKAEKLFFSAMSLKGYGKLDSEEVQEKICEEMGIITLTNIFVLGWVYYLGNQLTALAEVEK